ncbi:unnamed protein product [Lupinus luteus]|uniref:Uncharacterized protein n=1 Tax=Lupinus luteus TaxID=3873 RepID=A0AAV1VXG3_LUPLU
MNMETHHQRKEDSLNPLHLSLLHSSFPLPPLASLSLPPLASLSLSEMCPEKWR